MDYVMDTFDAAFDIFEAKQVLTLSSYGDIHQSKFPGQDQPSHYG
jgi:hypothetical protein